MESQIPPNLKYTKEHEWTAQDNQDNGVITVGITDFAQSSLGDIVFIELPEVGKKLDKDQAFGVVESVKSVSDLYAPLSGEVLEINQDLVSAPEGCNQDPYGSWMIKLKTAESAEISALLSSEDYSSYLNDLN